MLFYLPHATAQHPMVCHQITPRANFPRQDGSGNHASAAVLWPTQRICKSVPSFPKGCMHAGANCALHVIKLMDASSATASVALIFKRHVSFLANGKSHKEPALLNI